MEARRLEGWTAGMLEGYKALLLNQKIVGPFALHPASCALILTNFLFD
jgi:hypothetical protein